MQTKVDLERVRSTLRGLEDSIILSLFERARLKLNNDIYVPGAIKIPNFPGSFFDYLFKGTEELHAKAGRYIDPEEHPFYSDATQPIISRKSDNIGVEKRVNLNNTIREMYLEALQHICEPGDDNQYGRTALLDITSLQNISRRIHIGEQIAEAKYQQNPEAYDQLIKARDTEGIIEKLTNKKVEAEVLNRVQVKGERYNVNPEFIASFYKDKIIPLTIEVEIGYFYKRDSQ